MQIGRRDFRNNQHSIQSLLDLSDVLGWILEMELLASGKMKHAMIPFFPSQTTVVFAEHPVQQVVGETLI